MLLSVSHVQRFARLGVRKVNECVLGQRLGITYVDGRSARWNSPGWWALGDLKGPPTDESLA